MVCGLWCDVSMVCCVGVCAVVFLCVCCSVVFTCLLLYVGCSVCGVFFLCVYCGVWVVECFVWYEDCGMGVV